MMVNAATNQNRPLLGTKSSTSLPPITRKGVNQNGRKTFQWRSRSVGISQYTNLTPVRKHTPARIARPEDLLRSPSVMRDASPAIRPHTLCVRFAKSPGSQPLPGGSLCADFFAQCGVDCCRSRLVTSAAQSRSGISHAIRFTPLS